MNKTIKNIILITAKPRTGKSTCIKKFIDIVGINNCTGFYTEEVRDKENGERTGFVIKTLDGREKELASVNFNSEIKISRYGVNLKNFEELCLPIIEDSFNNNKILIIDEIGPMQIFSTKYKELLMRLANSNKIVVGTIFYDDYEFLNEFKKLQNIELIELSFENRDDMPSVLNNKVNMLMDVSKKILRKEEKSKKYLNELYRFNLDTIGITINSEHGIRNVKYENEKFSCTCDFYKYYGTCSHIMAVEKLVDKLINKI